MFPKDQATGWPIGIFLANDWWGWYHPILGGANPGLGDPGFYKKLVEQAIDSKPVSSPLPRPLHQLLSQGFCWIWPSALFSLNGLDYDLGSVSQINPFFPKVFMTIVYYHSTLTKTDWVLLCSPDWSGNHWLAQVGLRCIILHLHPHLQRFYNCSLFCYTQVELTYFSFSPKTVLLLHMSC